MGREVGEALWNIVFSITSGFPPWPANQKWSSDVNFCRKKKCTKLVISLFNKKLRIPRATSKSS
uniref:Uncharacterized protein n=1 Tax=Physcomitrium patens TaxID=3218 RepID=A0A2K1L7K5_PHYPA|nr:hypothetical protein PHYPA_000449 [Physcomitrium patens]